MARTDHDQPAAFPPSWRALGLFWAAVLTSLGSGAGVLAWLGPPPAAPMVAAAGAPGSPMHEHPAAVTEAAVHPAGQAKSGGIAEPDTALLDPPEPTTAGRLPVVAPDGRAPMRVYAAGFDPSSHLPRAALLLAGIGLNHAESDAAIRLLPAAVSLAVSPYAVDAGPLLALARARGHEFLIALPLEPTGYPLNDPGPQTLLTSAPPAENLTRLHWALSRIEGYAGATGVIGTMRGERLAAMPDQMEPVLSELARRGIFYVDPRTGGGAVTKAWGRHADLVIDEVADQASIDARLTALEQRAKDHGAALGVVMHPSPVALLRIAAWTNGLSARGVALAPVSAVISAPRDEAISMIDNVTERQP